MDATNETSERRRKTKAEPPTTAAEGDDPQLTLEPAVSSDAATTRLPELEQTAVSEPRAVETADEAGATQAPARSDRRRLEEQLEALKRRESELRRALAVADHPEVAEAVRILEGRAYAVASADSKLSQGLSKSEERRLETLQKKLAAVRAKRVELDGQIGELEAEIGQLGEERNRAFALERRQALQNLMADMNAHEDALRAAGLDASQLVPDIARLMPEIVALAEQLVEAAAQP